MFERTPTGLSLAAAGRALVDPARQVLRDFSVARESVRDVLGLAGGHLDIGAVPAVGVGWLMDHVVTFRRAYPEVGLRIHPETDDDSIAAQVRSGRYNLGLTVSFPGTSGLTATQVGAQCLNALLPPGFPGSGRPIGIEELAAMDLVTMHRDRSTSRRWLEAELSQRGMAPRVRIELGVTDGIVPLVAAGVGYALWWTPMTDTNLGDCVLRPLVPGWQRPIFISHRTGVLSPATEALLKIVRSAGLPSSI